eukprot:snap_masked-scaffold_4-processed-gene-8.27-mRNA-1 protein AED:0.30 eAED:1.00 QI:0/-1/0/1/-1/1/1/0/283
MSTCCFCLVWKINESTRGIVTKLGQYERTLEPGGPYCMNPVTEGLGYIVNLRQVQIPITVRTKLEKAEVSLTVKVQYQVIDTPEGIKNSKFSLANPVEQITAYVQDTLRSAVSSLSVEQVFDSKDEIGQEVFADLSEKMKGYGYEIKATLVTDVEPSQAVKNSFDLNNLNRYIKEADRFRQLISQSEKNTKSAAQRKREEVLGQGISQQRQEIVNGLKSSVDAFTDEVDGVSPRDVLELVLITQYFDMLKEVGDKAKVVYTPGNDGSAGQLRDSLLQGNLGIK